MVTLEEPKKVTPGEPCLTVPRKDPPTPETPSEPVTPLVGATWDSDYNSNPATNQGPIMEGQGPYPS